MSKTKKDLSKVKVKAKTFDELFDTEELKNNPFNYVSKLKVEDIEQLVTLLSDSYYNTGKSIVPDAIFDEILVILEDKSPTSSILSNVGAKTKRSIKLPFFTGSLNKIKPDSDLIDKWINKYNGPYVVSDKLDGVSCVIQVKEHGLKLYTRGDGKFGTDITHLRKHVLSDDATMPIGSVIRGELIISKKNFLKIEGVMENGRNAVSGLVGSKKINEDVAEITEFIAYGIMTPSYKQEKQMKLLQQNGFKVVDYKVMDEIDNDILSDYLIKRREKSPYNIDGIVVVDSSAKYEITGEENPDYGFAFKSILTNESAEVNVLEVEWNLSKNGYYKPRIKISPVKLAGVTVSNVTGFNAKYIKENIIGPGSLLKIIRSGDVIPHIVDVLSPAVNKKPQMPTGDYEWTDTGVDIFIEIDGSDDDNTNDIRTKQLAFFFKQLNIKGLDEKVVGKLVENKIDTVVKILTIKRSKLTSISGIGDKLVDKIKENTITQLKSAKLETLMAASQCFGRGLGKRKFKTILHVYPNIFKLRKENNDKELFDKIMKIDGFDRITTQQIVTGFDKFITYFNELNEVVDINHMKEIKKIKKKDDDDDNDNKLKEDNKLLGEVIVFTGVRDNVVEEFIENNGGEVKSGVSSKTTILIYSDTLDKLTNKLQDAKDKGVKLMKLSEFKLKYMN